MKLFREVLLIFGIAYAGELLSKLLSLPLPGALVGMLLLFALLQLRIVRLDQIAATADFLLGHLPFFFVPAGVALLASFSAIAHIWIFLLIICVVTTMITMGCSGWVIQKLMERKGRRS